ncbi:MAG: hypothetical protein U0746_15650 [Gemmataceae bacterium]
MALEPPTWCKGRQAKIEELAKATYRVTGPNLPDAVVSARITDELGWQAVLKAKADGPELATSTPVYDTPRDALAAAFELYRTHFVL